MQRHPAFCATRGPVRCGHHLADPAVIPATAAGWDITADGLLVPQLEIAGALSASGVASVSVTVVDSATSQAATAVLRHREVMQAITALTYHDRLARST